VEANEKKLCSSYYVLIYIASYFRVSLLGYCGSKMGDNNAKVCEEAGNRAKLLRVFNHSPFMYTNIERPVKHKP
jgi:hypothetical protein